MPVRIQRMRTKGWRAPVGAVNVSRPSRWGNPFLVSELGLDEAIKRFRLMMTDPRNIEEATRDLRGRDLMCWCPLDQPCHADVLLEIANS